MKKTYKLKNNEYKSKGEYEIAKFLDTFNIAFEYEFPIAVIDHEKPKIWYPDFYLKEYQVVVEYFGMYHHNEGYKDAADHKKEIFQKCGIQFVPIYHFNNNWEEYLLKSILMHQEMKAKKINKVLEKYQTKHEGFVKRLKSFLVKDKNIKNNTKAPTKIQKNNLNTNQKSKQIQKNITNKNNKPQTKNKTYSNNKKNNK